MLRVFLPIGFSCLALLSNCGAASADERAEAFFETRIRPVLVEHCYECHAADARHIRGGLLLDSRDGVRIGGDTGPAVVPENPDESLIISSLRHESFEMPPSQRLPDAVIADFEHWIRDGAYDPRDAAATKKERTIDLDEGAKFWCFQPVTNPTVPDSSDDHAVNDIDHFVAQRLESVALEPAPDASAIQVARRLYFGIIGLPPTPSQLSEFAAAWNDDPTTAIDATTDRLLQQPEYGERWGRYWLDVTRFAESSGGGRSLMHPNAWRFRDYVIRSFNADKPFDQLIREHIAGDLLPADDPVIHDEQITGSGYLILGAINYELQDKELLRMEVVDEQIDAVGSAFLGMTLGCARCHDHKFDPVPTSDYYALAGIFRSTESLTEGNVSGHVTTPLHSQYDTATIDTWQQETNRLNNELAALKTSDLTESEQAERTRQLNAALKKHKTSKPEIPVAMSVHDVKDPDDWHVHIRGGIRRLGPVVPRGFLSVVNVAASPSSNIGGDAIPQHESGRRQLADWIASPDNPLTSRVIVNRVWQHLIGEGLVRTPDNFGVTGQHPTHPELLDHLAHTFVHDDHWSIKSLIRRIVRSRVYRQSSDVSPTAHSLDPDNRLLSRAFRRRLDAEALRDSILLISDKFAAERGGLTIRKIETYDTAYDHATFSAALKSVYVPAFRNTRLDLFDVFDGANPNVVTGRRVNGILPAQTLFLLNSHFVTERATAAAAKFAAEQSSSSPQLDAMIDVAFLKTIGRQPTESERETVFLMLADNSDDSWAAVFHGLFASIDFRYLD